MKKDISKLPIIGQDKLVSELNRVFEIFASSEGEIKPHFILTGESGSGKTFTIQSLCALHKIDYMEINAAQITKEGTSGNSLSKSLAPMLNKQHNLTVIFVDEFDKLFVAGNSNNDIAHESTTGVQNEFLKLLECNTTQVFGDYGKYITIGLQKVLFIFAGAFNGEENITLDRLREMGIKTEFLGRVGLVYSTQPLTLEALNSIVDNSDLLTKYCMLFDEDFEKVSLYIKGYVKRFHEKNTLGARMINTLIQQYFIKGGVLNVDDAKEVTFQNKLTLK